MFSKVQADVDILIFSYIRNALGPYKIHYDCISMHFLSKFTLVQKIVLCCASIGVCFFEDHFYFHRSIPHKFPSFTLPIQLDYVRNVKWRNIDRTEECFILFSPFTNFRLLKNTEKCFWSEPSTSGVQRQHKKMTPSVEIHRLVVTKTLINQFQSIVNGHEKWQWIQVSLKAANTFSGWTSHLIDFLVLFSVYAE